MMRGKCRLVFVLAVLSMALAECSDSAANNPATNAGAASSSRIVQRVKAAGAGDVSAVSENALGQWFFKVKVCKIAEIAAPFKPVVGSGKTF